MIQCFVDDKFFQCFAISCYSDDFIGFPFVMAICSELHWLYRKNEMEPRLRGIVNEKLIGIFELSIQDFHKFWDETVSSSSAIFLSISIIEIARIDRINNVSRDDSSVVEPCMVDESGHVEAGVCQ